MARFDQTIARFGGDEFVVLLDGIRDVSDASRVAERIMDLLKRPFQIETHEVFTSASIGIAVSAAGYESPEDFLRNAETGMILFIGETVFRAACEQTRIWQQAFPYAADLSASINLSVKEFTRPDLVESIFTTLRDTGLNPRHLKLEITESAVMENVELVTATLMKLRTHNIQLSIDDFGTGYSSLSYLHRFPLNNLKIDQIFVREMHTSSENQLIVRTILMLAQNLRMNVIAEGIENVEQLVILREQQCDYGQGYFFARPLDVGAATALLADSVVWEEALSER